MAQTVDTLIVSALESIAPVWNSVKEQNNDNTEETGTYFVFN